MMASILLAALLGVTAQAEQPQAAETPRGADVAGQWTVDLRVNDGDEPYTQPMVLNIAADGVVTGEFYNSAISSGRYGRNRGRSCVAFVTSDGMGDYQHAACLIDGRMVGQSWAEHRRFVLPWVASR